MTQRLLLGILLLIFNLNLLSAQQERGFFYATMDSFSATELLAEYPNEITLIKTKGAQAVVYMSDFAAHKLHDNILTHGPGYVFMPTKTMALAQLNQNNQVKAKSSFAYSLTEAALVDQALPMVNAANIQSTILNLQSYGTRYHTKATATQAVTDLKEQLEAMIAAAAREDISVRIVDHNGTNMPSLVVTIPGGAMADEYVILGGHIDSTAPDKNNAPGADDNASGIATITEVFRVLLDMDFRPKRTVEFMAFAAEEIGLVGSFEIAQEYKNSAVNVYSYMQLDMTNYNGSANDVYLMTDSYISSSLNDFVIDLLETYNASGEHALTYGTSICNYGCSDHFSWAQQGYEVVFPFEASFSGRNPNIHSPGDTFSVSGTAQHAAKFAKIGLEYILEAAKSELLSTDSFNGQELQIRVVGNKLVYNLNQSAAINAVSIYNVIGQQLLVERLSNEQGTVALQGLKSGVYVAVFSAANGGRIAKKFVVN